MRPSRVTALSFCRRDLVYDPGGLRHASPYRRRRILRSSRMKLSAVHFDKNRHSYLGLSRTGPQLSNNFRGSIHTPSTCFPRLPTFVSSGRRVQLLGCWLGFARGRIYTSWIASTDFIERATLEFHSYVTLHDIQTVIEAPVRICRTVTCKRATYRRGGPNPDVPGSSKEGSLYLPGRRNMEFHDDGYSGQGPNGDLPSPGGQHGPTTRMDRAFPRGTVPDALPSDMTERSRNIRGQRDSGSASDRAYPRATFQQQGEHESENHSPGQSSSNRDQSSNNRDEGDGYYGGRPESIPRGSALDSPTDSRQFEADLPAQPGGPEIRGPRQPQPPQDNQTPTSRKPSIGRLFSFGRRQRPSSLTQEDRYPNQRAAYNKPVDTRSNPSFIRPRRLPTTDAPTTDAPH